MKYKTIDLFAGIGGIRRGFELTGRFKNVLSAEIDKYACQTYEYLFNEDPTNDVTSEEFKNKVESTDYDILMGGFPCQAFSIAGKKEGFRDKTRGTLFFDVADIIERTKPKAFLLENVEGLIRHKSGTTFRIILETLVNDLNYKVIGVDKNTFTGKLEYNPREFVVNSRNYGVPQNRPRVFIMGFNRNIYGDKVDNLPINEIPKKRNSKSIYKDLNDLLEFLADPKYYIPEGYLETLRKHKSNHKEKGNGFGYIVVNSPEIQNPISNAILATGGSGRERNMVYDPQDNIVGMQIKGKKTPLNSEGLRFMTPREWGKLQGFIGYAFVDKNTKVDKFSFPEKVSNAQRYKQFGNSVTIPVVETMAQAIIKCLDFLQNDV
jgi:DNA (cytosine-5)-methyltransferase 1